MTAHTLKELEKALPSVASINGMQAKDYLQDLANDNKIHIEKIGSGNWYWSFASEESKIRETELAKLRAELESAQAHVVELETKVQAAREERAEGEDGEREELVKRQEGLLEEVSALRKEVEGFKVKAERWTDNLLLVEGYTLKLTGGNGESMDALRRQVYGEQYIEGEGLAEL